MHKVKTQAMRNASSASRHGVCRDTPENMNVATRAGPTTNAAIRASRRDNRFIRLFSSSLLVAADAAESFRLRDGAGLEPRARFRRLTGSGRVANQLLEIPARDVR